jgi:dipeptidyl-peptidase-4
MKSIFLGFLLVSGFTFFAYPSGGSPGTVSIENMFYPGFQAKLSTPGYIWLQNGKVFLLDYRVEPGKRTFELLDPREGNRAPIVEASKILVSFKKHLGQEAPEVLKWPDAVDPMGTRIIYILAGDLFLVEFPAGEVKRLTQTPSEETSVTFSPDGEWISFIRDNDIYALRGETGKEHRLTTGATDMLLNGPLSWVYWEEIYDHAAVPYAWSPDSGSIAYLQTDDAPVSLSTFVHFEPVTQGVVRQRYPKAGQTNPKVRLGIVDIASAKTTWLECGDYEYLARFNWLPDSSAIAVQTLNRKQSFLKLLLADKHTGKSQLILEEKHPAWIDIDNSLYFFKKKKQFIWSSERDNYRHLYLYRLDGQLIRQLTKGNFQVVSSSRGLLSGAGGLVGVDEKRGFVYFTSNREALRERHLYRVKMNGKGLKRLSTGAGVHGVWFSPDMTYYLDTYSNTMRPPGLTLYNADGSKREVITPPAKEVVAEWQLVPPEFHTFTADDGLELAVMMTKPLHFDKTGKYPAIIYVYGGPVSQQVVDYWSTRRVLWTDLLGREGYVTFVVEVRAGAGINKAVETSVYRQAYGKQNVKDILAGVKWIKQKPFIDPGRIGIWGGSGGGCTTIYTMTHADVFKAGISLFPVSDWRFYDTIYTERFLSTPQDNPEGYRDTSAVRSAADLHGRLLIVHGTYDDNVHPQNTWAFIDQLIAHNIQFDLMIYPWRKHGISDYPARVHLYTLMLDFWKKHL